MLFAVLEIASWSIVPVSVFDTMGPATAISLFDESYASSCTAVLAEVRRLK